MSAKASELFWLVIEGFGYANYASVSAEQIAYLSSSHGMKVISEWKVAGENKIHVFVEGEASMLDRFVVLMPIIQKDTAVKVTVTPLVLYETFANNLNVLVGADKKYEPSPPHKEDTTGNTMYYLMDVHVEQKDLAIDKLLEIWLKEADYAIKAKVANSVVDIWKVAGTRQAVVIIGVDSPSTLDMVTFNLPMTKLMGGNISIAIKRLLKL